MEFLRGGARGGGPSKEAHLGARDKADKGGVGTDEGSGAGDERKQGPGDPATGTPDAEADEELAGRLWVHCLGARGLRGADWTPFRKATSDPYLRVWLRGQDPREAKQTRRYAGTTLTLARSTISMDR